MTPTTGKSGQVRVTCPDHTSKPMTRDRAERHLAEIERIGACPYEHRIEDA